MIAKTHKENMLSWTVLLCWLALSFAVLSLGGNGTLLIFWAGLAGWLVGFYTTAEGFRSIPNVIVFSGLFIVEVRLFISQSRPHVAELAYDTFTFLSSFGFGFIRIRSF